MKRLQIVAVALFALAAGALMIGLIQAASSAPVAQVDSDADGFVDALELYLPTDPLDNCPDNSADDAWPLDMDRNRLINVLWDILPFRGYVGLMDADPMWGPQAQRHDLDGDGAVSCYGDVYAMYYGMLYATCDGGTPPPPPWPDPAPPVAMAIDPDATGNSESSLGRTEACVRIDVDPAYFGDGVADHAIDVCVTGDTQAPVTYDAWFYYEPGLVDPISWLDTIKLPDASGFSQDLEMVSRFNASAGYVAGGSISSGTAGDGTVARVNLDVIGPGLASFDFAFARSAYWSGAGAHTLTIVSGPLALAINTDCNTDRALELAGASAVGDDLSDPLDTDDDGDGFSDVVEQYLGTEPLDNCPKSPPGPGGEAWPLPNGDAWPLDINVDTFVTVVGDVLPYSGRIGATGGPPPSANWLKRLDLNMDNYLTVVADVLKFSGNIGKTCS
jgi:hypothetical protein